MAFNGIYITLRVTERNVYRKGDIVMEPMNSRDVLPKNVPGVGWGGVGWGGVGWGGGVGCGVGWV